MPIYKITYPSAHIEPQFTETMYKLQSIHKTDITLVSLCGHYKVIGNLEYRVPLSVDDRIPFSKLPTYFGEDWHVETNSTHQTTGAKS